MKKCPQCARLFEGEAFVCPQCRYTPAAREGFDCFAPDFDAEHAGYPADVFDRLYEIEDRNFWFCARNKLICWALSRFFPSAESFLEVGCGTGVVLKAVANAMPDMRLVGSEIFPAGLRCARRRMGGRARLIQMDVLNTPFDAEFDVIGAFDVLEHIDRDEEALSQIHRAVKPRGGVIITVPAHRWLWSNLDDIARHRRRYSRRELVRKMSGAGFECVYAASFISLLLPLMLISRCRKMDFDKARGELSLPRFINGILGGITALEITGVKMGLRYPAGGSLLMVGRRC